MPRVWPAPKPKPCGMRRADVRGRRPGRAAGRLRLRRLPAGRRPGPLQPDHGRRARTRRGGRLRARHLQRLQVLAEAGLVPGALRRNSTLALRASLGRDLSVERPTRHFTRAIPPGRTLRLPIAHGEGQLLTRLTTTSTPSRRAAASSSATPSRRAIPNGSAARHRRRHATWRAGRGGADAALERASEAHPRLRMTACSSSARWSRAWPSPAAPAGGRHDAP